MSRALGDIEAKDPRYGGNTKVVISTPEIHSFKLKKHHDFILLGCDGIFEKLSNKQIIESCVKVAKTSKLQLNEMAGSIIDNLMMGCVEEAALDNITGVLIGLNGIEQMHSKKQFLVTIEEP